MKIVTNMKGFSNWILKHPRKNLTGFFTINGKPVVHDKVKRIVAYCVEKGYRTEEDLPEDELQKLMEE